MFRKHTYKLRKLSTKGLAVEQARLREEAAEKYELPPERRAVDIHGCHIVNTRGCLEFSAFRVSGFNRLQGLGV